jgi:serine/threonine protein kinase/tetratricopeptide (TPR) repeat protein
MTDKPDASETPTLSGGEKIGKYEIRERLGHGGQSIVYKAYDPTLDRYVAIKQISPSLAGDPAYVEQLKTNFRKIASLGSSCEAIVTIHEVIEESRGLFYVMEFVDGHTLETLIRENEEPIEPKAVLLILFRLAGALHDVHSVGIIHRDMKPSNVIITEGLRPKIIDFGVAAAAGGDISMPLATTKYLAPELYSGPQADERADIYSLGFMAYEMLLGRRQFNDIFSDIVRDPHGQALRWMKWHGNEAVSAPPLSEVNPAIPQPLSDIVQKMIRKDPEQRYRDTEQLGRAIKQAFSPRRAPSPPPQTVRGDAMRKVAAPSGIGSLEGDELEIDQAPASAEMPSLKQTVQAETAASDAEGPLTAPLPKGPMSRRKKIALLAAGIAVGIVLIGLGVGWVIQARQQRQAQAQTAESLFNQGGKAYVAGQWAEAIDAFATLRDQYPQTLQGRKATVLAPMARAQRAIETGQWDQAQLEERDAESAAETLQAQADSDRLVQWTRDRLDDIEKIKQKRFATRTFSEAMARAAAGLNAPPASQVDLYFDRLKRELENALSGVALTDAQQADAAEMFRRIARTRLEELYGQAIRRGDEQVRQGDFTTAGDAYRQAQQIASSESATALLADDRRQALRREATTKLQSLSQQRSLKELQQAIDEARQAGDAPALQRALESALAAEGWSDTQQQAMQEQLQSIRFQAALDNARNAYQAGRYDAARSAIQTALKLQPDHPEARRLKDDIANAARRDELIRKGDAALVARDYTEALEHFRQAARLGAQPADLQKKIARAEYELAMQQGDQLVQQGQWDQAERTYLKARQLRPEAAAQVEARLILMRTQRQYQRYLDEGDEALKANRWAAATAAYRQAQQIRDTALVQKRLQLTTYKRHITEGKAALRDEDFATARWHFKLALDAMNTPEAQQLLEQASQDEP